MRVVFMGTPDFAVPSLEALAAADGIEVAGVATRPDAVRGRGKKLVASPVKARALELGLPVLEASRLTADAVDAVRAWAPDAICVAAYGCILPEAVLAMAPLGCVNVHASLLPRWRGAAPVQRAILAGDELAGVSIMAMEKGLDTGAYCAQVSTPVASKGAVELMAELGRLGAPALVDALRSIKDGSVAWTAQDESQVTYAHKVEKPEMLLDPADPASANARRVQASTDAAPARATVADKGVRVMAAAVPAGSGPQVPVVAPGAVAVAGKHVYLGCADGPLELLSVKPDGKRQMDASAWAAGLHGAGLAWGRI